MSTYKLYYFDSRGSGEPIRIIFAQAGVKYEDLRFTREQWANEHKQSKICSFQERYYDCICILF